MGAVESALRLVPELAVETIESSCCGMAGSFGYHAETIDVSLAMGELSLLPAVRKAPADAIIVADGTSCRHQIQDGTGRGAIHVARVLLVSKADDRAYGACDQQFRGRNRLRPHANPLAPLTKPQRHDAKVERTDNASEQRISG